jgi:hypothetical protein
MATAAYGQAHHLSILGWPAHPYTIATYRLVADVFGRYHMLPLRIATDFLVGAIAALIYWWMLRATSRWCALLTAAFYGVYSMSCNGYMVCREFPCSWSLVAGACLFIVSTGATGSRERWLLFASGCVTGSALFFKEQAAYITQAIPLWLILQAACDRRRQPWLGKALWYAAGGLTAGLVYFVPFVLGSTLTEHLDSLLDYGAGFGGLGQTSVPQRLLPESTRLIDQFLLNRPVPFFLLIAYVACLLEWIGVGRRLLAGRSANDVVGNPALRCRSSGLLAVCYVLTSSAAVAMGNRFGSGYFLLWLPFIFVAGGQGLYFLTAYSTRRWGNPLTLPAVAVGVYALQTYLLGPVALGLLILITGLTIWEAYRQRRGWRATPWLQLILLAMALGTFAVECPGTYYWPRLKARLNGQFVSAVKSVKLFSKDALPTDRLFVWGSRPEFYCVAGLTPATRFVVCGYADGHWFETDGIPESWSRKLLQELRTSRPRFIVAAPADEHDPYGLFAVSGDAFPALAKFLAADYRLAASYPGCDVYERR